MCQQNRPRVPKIARAIAKSVVVGVRGPGYPLGVPRKNPPGGALGRRSCPSVPQRKGCEGRSPSRSQLCNSPNVKILSLYKRALIAYNYDHVNGDFSAVVRGSFIRSGLRVELSVLFWLIAEFRRASTISADVPRKRASWNKVGS